MGTLVLSAAKRRQIQRRQRLERNDVAPWECPSCKTFQKTSRCRTCTPM